MFTSVKAKALLAKSSAAAAGAAARQWIVAVKERSYDANLKEPLVLDQSQPEEAQAEPRWAAQYHRVTSEADADCSGSKFDAGAMKDKIIMAGIQAGSAMKLGVGKVKQKCDVAAVEATEKLLKGGSSMKASMGTAKDRCDAKVGAVKDKLHAMEARVMNLSVALSPIETECVDMVVAMGFPRRRLTAG